MNTAVYLLNRCPTSSLEKKTPFEVFSGRKPGVKHLKVFGSVCYALIPSQLRHKLQETSNKCIFVGYGNCEKGYRLFNLKTQKINISRDVVFNEDTKWNWEEGVEDEITVPITIGETGNEVESLTQISAHSPHQSQLQQSPQHTLPQSHSENSQDTQSSDSQNSTSSSTPVKLKSLSEIYATCNYCIVEPENFEEAESDIAWKKAMEEEMAMIEKNSTWELVSRPSDKPVIGVKWVYKTKLNLGWHSAEEQSKTGSKRLLSTTRS